MRTDWKFLMAGLLVAAAACAHGRTSVAGAAAPQPPDTLVVNVTNHGTYQVDLHAISRAHDLRIGIVDPGSTGHFVLREHWLFGPPVEIVAGGLRSGFMMLRPGDVLDWDLQGTFIHTRMIPRTQGT